MIARIRGSVVFVGEHFILLDVTGVGYKINVSGETLRSIGAKKDAEVTLWTHLAVRETSLELFGFPTYAELEFFQLLITVSGIGPKSALAILGVAPIDTLKHAIAANESSYLTKVSGIGKKTAGKIVLELKDKLGAGDTTGMPTLKEESEALEALEALGYSTRQAREALREVKKESATTNEKIKEALKILGKER